MELTKQHILEYFNSTNINHAYFDYFESSVISKYKKLQKDCPEDDDNEEFSLEYARDTAFIYINQIEMGHSKEWADVYVKCKYSGEHECDIVYSAYDAVSDKNIADNDLNIYINSLSSDPLFKEYYNYLFKQRESDLKEQTLAYCDGYHSCIKNGKSKYYAHAYGDVCNTYDIDFIDIYASSYEIAREHNMNDFEAVMFGEMCTDYFDQGSFSEMESFIEHYHKDWQVEYYVQLIIQDFQNNKSSDFDDELLDNIREEIRQRVEQIRGNNSNVSDAIKERSVVIGMDKFYSELLEPQNKIKQVKEECESYSAEDMLDMMFPDRHDDDFDEDSMSYESVFGKD